MKKKELRKRESEFRQKIQNENRLEKRKWIKTRKKIIVKREWRMKKAKEDTKK